MDINDPTSANRRLIISRRLVWDDLPAPAGTTARGTIVGYLEHPPQASTENRLTIMLIERRRTATASSAYVSQLLIGDLLNQENSSPLFSLKETQQHHLWCNRCFADNPDAAGTGGLRIPRWLKGRYFSGLPPCSSCGTPLNFFNPLTQPPPRRNYVFESINSPPLQSWVEEQFAPHGIATASLARQHGPAATTEFGDELLEVAFCPERIGHVDATYGRQAVRELMRH